MLDEITVVILSRDRNEYLRETINYYEKNKIKTLVFHNSEFKLNPDFEWKLNTYIHSNKSYIERAGLVGNFLRSKIAILSTDDERYLPSALVEMAKQLENQSYLGSVGGQTVGVYNYGKNICGRINYGYLLGYSNSDNNCEKRVKYHFNRAGNQITFSGMYRMYTAENFLKMLELFSKNYGISTPYITEVTAEIYSLSLGPISYVNNLQWIRNWSNPPIDKLDWNRKIIFYEWWCQPKYTKEKETWIRNLIEEISQQDLTVILNALVENRMLEIRKQNVQSRLPNLNKDLKFKIMKLLNYKGIPTTLEEIMKQLCGQQIMYIESEFMHAIQSMNLNGWESKS